MDLVIIGNLAFETIRLARGREYSCQSGSAYLMAAGASLVSNKVGIVARVGRDFDLADLKAWNLDISGVEVSSGQTPKFVSIRHKNGSFSFNYTMGVASIVKPEIYPRKYLSAKYIHLASNLPQQQLLWIDYLRSRVSKRTKFSVDMFELFVRKYPELTRKIINEADIVFLNNFEFSLLNKDKNFSIDVPYIVKKGSGGAEYRLNNRLIEVSAPKTIAVDTSGAGEILAGVYLSLRAQGVKVKPALERAVYTATLRVEKRGVKHLHV